MSKITVKQNSEKEIPVEIMAQAIADISNGFKKLQTSRLEKRAIILLINDLTGVPKGEIRKVLDATAELERHFLKPIKK